MKSLAFATLAALLVGLGIGIVIERDRRLPASQEAEVPAASEPRPAAETPRDARVAALESDLARLSTRLAALEARPAAAPAPAEWAGPASRPAPVHTGPQLDALRAEMAALIGKRDGEGLVFLVRRLYELGEAGYPSIMEIARLLFEDEEKENPEFGQPSLESVFFAEGMAPLSIWALAHPDISPKGFRAGAIESLSGRSDLDVAQVFLAALRQETDPDLLVELCSAISGKFRPAIAEDVEAAARTLTNEDAIDTLLGALGADASESSEKALRRLAAGASDDVRDRAKAELALLSPPDSGFLLMSVNRDSTWYDGGLRTADLILEVNGRRVSDDQDALAMLQNAGETDTLVLKVRREGEVRSVTVRGSDGLWEGWMVAKPE